MVELSQDKWNENREKDSTSVMLDVRTPEEYEEKHIPGAKLINIREPQAFMEAIQQLPKDASYFVYCRSGARSAQACQVLDQLGVEATFNLKGGILDWRGEVVA